MAEAAPLRVGIAGFGVVGEIRRRSIDAHPQLRVTAVCDQRFAEPSQADDGLLRLPSAELLLEQQLDALFVCLPNYLAPSVTIQGLEAGLHVFCEKPPGREPKDVVGVREVEARHPELRLMYGFNHRYHDSVRDALELVRSGDFGRVIDMRGVYGKSRIIKYDGSEADWRTRRNMAGGGILLDQGIHLVDMLRMFADDEFTHVSSHISNDFWRHDVEDNAYALLRTDSGVVALLQSSATQWRHRFTLDITLERGSISLAGILSNSKSYGAETITVAFPSERDAGDPREQTTRYNDDRSWALEVADFAASVLDGTPVQRGSSLEALRTMELVYRIYCADRDWAARWDLDQALAIEASDA